MKHPKAFFIFSLVVGLLLGALAVGSLRALPVVAGPPAVPTPIAQPAGGGDWSMVTLMSADTVSGTETGSAIQIAAYTAADVQWNLGFTGSETVTCKLQFSNDNSAWADGVNIVASASADVINMDQFQLFGRYCRAVCTPTGSATFTSTITAKVHN